jgi:hypothetical protein
MSILIVRRLCLWIGSALLAVCTVTSVRALQVDESQARCQWNEEFQFCEDIHCAVDEGYCFGDTPEECICVL